MRTTVTQDKERASIHFMLFDENAVMIGQSTFTRFKKTKIVKRQKKVVSQGPGQPISVSTQNCNNGASNCTGGAYSGIQQGTTETTTEDLEPVVIEIPPVITSRDVGQAMIMLYDSVR